MITGFVDMPTVHSRGGVRKMRASKGMLLPGTIGGRSAFISSLRSCSQSSSAGVVVTGSGGSVTASFFVVNVVVMVAGSVVVVVNSLVGDVIGIDSDAGDSDPSGFKEPA